MGFLFVALGGALGAVLRYAISLIPCKTVFPFLTLITNVLSALLMGFVTGAALKRGLPDNALLFLRVGVCGGFSTLSALSLEAYNLFQNGNHFLAVLYSLLSVALCIAGIWAGILLAEAVVKN